MSVFSNNANSGMLNLVLLFRAYEDTKSQGIQVDTWKWLQDWKASFIAGYLKSSVCLL